MLDETTRKCSEKDITILLGDMYAKVGNENTGYEQVMGKHGLGTMNENGKLFANFCANYNLVTGGTIFPHKKCHLSRLKNRKPNRPPLYRISKRFRGSLQDVHVRAKRGADTATDHHLIVAKVKLKPKKYLNSTSTGKRHNVSELHVSMLTNKEKKAEFKIEVNNRFEALQNETSETVTTEDHWQQVKQAFTSACETVVGLKNKKHQDWISPETLVKVEKRKNLKNMLNNSKTRSTKQIASKAYTEANEEVKSSARKDKRAFVDKLTEEAEEAARQNNIKALYDNIKLLTRKYQKGSRPVKHIEGKTLNTKEEQMSRWVEHFKNILNKEAPMNKVDILQKMYLLKKLYQLIAKDHQKERS